MKFRLERKPDTDNWRDAVTFSGEINADDILSLKFDGLDKALFDQINGDPTATPADHLLVLEMLFRRLADQTGKERV